MQKVNGIGLIPEQFAKNKKMRRPEVVKRYGIKQNTHLVLTQKFTNKEEYTQKALALYEEKEIAKGLTTCRLIETKMVAIYPDGSKTFYKKVYDKSGKKIATFWEYDHIISSKTPQLNIILTKLQGKLDVIRIYQKRKDGFKPETLRPETKRLLKLISNPLK